MRTKTRPPVHKAQWWPEGASIRVSKESRDERVVGGTFEVCTGKLIKCPYARCCEEIPRKCIGLGISVRVPNVTWLTQGCTYGNAIGLSAIIVCLQDVLRKPPTGFRFCGHKKSDDRCWCSYGYTHLKDGSW